MSETKTPEISMDSLLTSYQVGALLQVNPSSVNKWVKDGRMPAFRTPGGHRRIRAADLVAFLTEHSMPVPQSLAAATRRRVLIVEHERRDVEAALQKAQSQADRLEVVCVDNVMDAMLQVGVFKPHAIILDAHLPQTDSLEICRRLSSNSQTKGAQIFVSSNDLQPNFEQLAKNAGAKGFLNKPLDWNAVLNALHL